MILHLFVSVFWLYVSKHVQLYTHFITPMLQTFHLYFLVTFYHLRSCIFLYIFIKKPFYLWLCRYLYLSIILPLPASPSLPSLPLSSTYACFSALILCDSHHSENRCHPKRISLQQLYFSNCRFASV